MMLKRFFKFLKYGNQDRETPVLEELLLTDKNPELKK
jgi:hypothetical protein